MKGLDLYKWIAGSMNDFARQFNENEALYNQAKSFWGHLEESSIITIAIFLILGVVLAVTYYLPYNEKAGRHYRPTHWGIFLFITFVATLFTTIGIEYIAVAPKLNGAFMVELKVALGNAIYASLVYFLTSIVWCNWCPTNAYRLFKF